MKKTFRLAALVLAICFVLNGAAAWSDDAADKEVLDRCQKAIQKLKVIRAVENALDNTPVILENSVYLDNGINALGWFAAQKENTEHEITDQVLQHLRTKLAGEAAGELEAATKLAPNRASYAWFLLGCVQYRYLKRYDEAVANIKQALKIEIDIAADNAGANKKKNEGSIHTQIGLVWATIARERSKGNKFDESIIAINKLRDQFNSFTMAPGMDPRGLSVLDLGYIVASMYAQIDSKDETLSVLNTLHRRNDYTRQSKEENTDFKRFLDISRARYDKDFKTLQTEKEFNDLMTKAEKAKLDGEKVKPENKWDTIKAIEKFKADIEKKTEEEDKKAAEKPADNPTTKPDNKKTKPGEKPADKPEDKPEDKKEEGGDKKEEK